MPGVVTKKAILTNIKEIYRLGGWKLIWATLKAPKGTPFMAVYAPFIWENK